MVDLSAMHGNKKIWISRPSFMLLVANSSLDDSASALVSKILERLFKIERETGKVCVKIPVKVHEMKKLFTVNPALNKYVHIGTYN